MIIRNRDGRPKTEDRSFPRSYTIEFEFETEFETELSSTSPEVATENYKFIQNSIGGSLTRRMSGCPRSSESSIFGLRSSVLITLIDLNTNWLLPIVLAYSLFLFSACEEQFNPNIEGAEPVLVIEGAITNLPGPYTVKLSNSSGVYADDQLAIENAIVKIIEEGGEEETLTEIEAGTYITSETGMQGTTDKNYKIDIQLPDGTRYESEYQKMLTLIRIDSVEADVEFHYLSIANPDVPGYQFHVSTELGVDSENYFLWSLESTYKYRSDFTINYFYEDYMVQEFPDPTSLMTCWRTDQINEIYTFNTSVLSEPKVERLPLNFARIDQPELYIRYSLLVKQFTINKEAYMYWDKIQRQIESQETLYNNQPFQIRGNLFNVDDPDEMVLGYFMVAAQDEQRVFVNPPADIEVRKDSCFLDYMSYGFITFFDDSRWPIYIFEDMNGGRALATKGCFDCTELGGTIVEPEFWEE